MGVVIVICLPLPQRKPLRSTASERLLYFDPQGLGHFCLSGDLQTGRVCGYGLSFPFYEMGLEGSSGMAWGGLVAWWTGVQPGTLVWPSRVHSAGDMDRGGSSCLQEGPVDGR